MRLLVRMMLTLVLMGGIATAAVYKWVDESGAVHYGDCPPGDCTPETLELAEPPSEAEVERARQRVKRYKRLSNDTETPASETAPPETEAATPDALAEARCFSKAGVAIPGPAAEVFTPITPTVLTKRQRQDLDRLFRRLDHDWSGHLTETWCEGSESEPRSVLRKSKVDLKIRWDRMHSQLTNRIKTVGQDKRIQSRIQRFEVGEALFFNNIGEETTIAIDANRVELLALDDQALTFLVKVSERLATGARKPRADLRRLRLSGRTLEITELFYRNGVLTGRRDWVLTR